LAIIKDDVISTVVLTIIMLWDIVGFTPLFPNIAQSIYVCFFHVISPLAD
jgi:hypothetical protein